MNLPGYYSSGQFANMAKVSVRTIRYYDKQNILKPSYINQSGARFYTDADFAKLQQILLLKYLGFSLDDIREMTIADMDYHFMLNSLNLQKRLIADRIEQMQLIEKAVEDTMTTIKEHQQLDGMQMLNLIHLTEMEHSLKNQYQNATNISARIRLHNEYSSNKQGWFPWIYEKCNVHEGMKILELGCGDGSLWSYNIAKLPLNCHITLSDISEGMLRDAKRNIGTEHEQFSYHAFDCHQIPYEDSAFDLVIANHLLFYCEDMKQVCREVQRVLRADGVFLCSAYGRKHMQEISKLAASFDSRIILSAEKLYKYFGLENGARKLMDIFASIECMRYDDEIIVDCAEPLIAYILSCHGNQNQMLLDRYKEFRTFVERKVKRGFHITKDAGIFICQKI